MKPLLYIVIVVYSIVEPVGVVATNYFFSASGNDANSGTNISSPWLSIQQLNTVDLQAGDSVFFEANAIFYGSVHLDPTDAGTASSPVVITSYGNGKAIINAGTGFGIQAYNCAGIHLMNLKIIGNGPATNTGSGIEFYMDVAYDLNHIRINNCEISGFGNKGIEIGCWNTYNGFADVEVNAVSCFENGIGGMGSYGYNTSYNHKNFRVSNSVFYNNRGVSGITDRHTGSGIVLSGIDGARIEYCEAYNNGENNANPGGGPVGIWFYLVKNGTIQYCESHHNRTATIDGGGFDIDGGCQNCIIQHCYSHDNDGAGYLLAEYGSGIEYSNNIIRYNISQDDARKNSAGAITVWGADHNNRIMQSWVYNNTVYTGNTGITNGSPSAVKLIGDNFSDVKLYNNIFYATAGIDLVQADMNIDSSRLHFVSNDYFQFNGSPSFSWQSNIYSGLASWKAAAITQERRGSRQFGFSIDPLLVNAGSAGTAGLLQLQQMPTLLAAYKLSLNSAMLDAGSDLNAAFGISIGSSDFFRGAPKTGTSQDIGAHECVDCYSVLPVQLVQFNAVRKEKSIVLSWTVKDETSISRYEPQCSANGLDFFSRAVIYAAAQRNYTIIDSALTNRFYRLKLIGTDGKISYSGTRTIEAFKQKLVVCLQNPVSDLLHFTIISDEKQFLNLQLYGMNGVVLASATLPILAGTSTHQWKPALSKGLFLLRIVSNNGLVETIPFLKR